MDVYHHSIDPDKSINIDVVRKIISQKTSLTLSKNAKQKIIACKEFLDEKVKPGKNTWYGINTGFGSLCNTQIPAPSLNKLQENLVKSHACGIGKTVPDTIVKLMLFLKIHSLSHGYSGISLTLAEKLIALFNQEIYPEIFEQGSLGASGDLAPLAHLTLPLLYEGNVLVNNKKQPAKKALEIANIAPHQLQAKEGLAMLNGTQFMSAYGAYILCHSKSLFETALHIAAISIDAFDAKTEPYDEKIQAIRNQKGQQNVAAKLRDLLSGSKLQKAEKKHVQDPYSFRCIPQVLGATIDVWEHVAHIITNEINGVTDNPNIFAEQDMILSGGNFHGQPLAMALDYLAIALAEIGSISERRTYQLLNGKRGLPDFLTPNPGINSGFMILQYTAASIVSQNKQLCTPSSVDSIDSSNGQEDHVSMGANSALKAFTILQNIEKVLALELMVAAQALEFRPVETSPKLKHLHQSYRKYVPFITNDSYMHPHIEKSIEFVQREIAKANN